MQELKIKVQPSELEMMLGFISLLKKQGMFSRVEPEIVELVKKAGENEDLKPSEANRMDKIEEELLQRVDDIDAGKAKILNSEEFKSKIDSWKKEKLR